MKKLLALLMTGAMAFGLAGCSSSDSSSSADADTIKIGVFQSLTGENGAGGAQEHDGVLFANEKFPTVLGKEIELVVVDNKSDKAEATTAVARLIEQEGVVAILGSYGSAVCIAAGDTIAQAGIPTIAATATNVNVTLGNDYYFRACFLDPFQGTVMANYAMGAGYETAAVIYQNGDDYSTGLANYFMMEYEAIGGEVVVEQVFQTGDTDFNAILTNVKAAAPDCIFAPSSATTAPLLIQQAKALGIESTIMAGDTWENSILFDVAGDDVNGVVISAFFDAASPANDTAAEFVEEYQARLGEDVAIPGVAALGYDSYIILIDAIERAGVAEPEAIREALVETSLECVTGLTEFDENGDAIKTMAVIKQANNGQFEYVETVEL